MHLVTGSNFLATRCCAKQDTLTQYTIETSMTKQTALFVACPHPFRSYIELLYIVEQLAILSLSPYPPSITLRSPHRDFAMRLLRRSFVRHRSESFTKRTNI